MVLATVFILAACSDDAAAEPVIQVAGSDAVEMLDNRTVIDVRTPAEYAEAHVVGALNIDVQSADFTTRVEELDKDEPYLIYCHSGRRSAIAADQMAEAGFTDIADAGGLTDLATAGAAIE
jgi:phage shock protein E